MSPGPSTPVVDVPCERGPMINTQADLPIMRYLYPSEAVFLFIFLSYAFRRIRNQQSRIVAYNSFILLAAVDFCLVITMIPGSMSVYEPFYNNEGFRRFVHHTKISINALSNVFSAIEVYLTVAIVVEWYLRVKNSSYQRFFVVGRRYYILLVGIFLTTLVFTSYHFILYELRTGYRCNGDKLVSKLMLSPRLSPSTVYFLNICQAMFVIVLPCITVAFFNYRMIPSNVDGKLPLAVEEAQELFRSTDSLQIQNDRIRCTTHMITAVFVISHVVSFIPFLYDIFPALYGSQLFPVIVTVVNSSLMLGKLSTLVLVFKNSQLLSRMGYC